MNQRAINFFSKEVEKYRSDLLQKYTDLLKLFGPVSYNQSFEIKSDEHKYRDFLAYHYQTIVAVIIADSDSGNGVVHNERIAFGSKQVLDGDITINLTISNRK